MPRKEFETLCDTPGGFLRMCRKKKGATQLWIKDRCRTLGVPDIHVSSLEVGQRKVTLQNIDKIAQVYELTQEEKKGLRELLGQTEDLHQRLSGQKEFKIFYELMQLPVEVRKRVLRAATAYDASENNAQ